ncbi:hypothetical protein [Brevibacillus brevis]|uniref:hypothetical protein n=1 Tax=Brevibacillus brevis TaxID=1393 RepID=UPI00165E7B19|nr:hypothetical protein [Brevibacillus brevis]
MDFLTEYVEQFLENKPNYNNDINTIRRFLIETKKDSKEALQGVRTETIIDSLKYYINCSKVTSRDTAQRYSFAVKELFMFLFYKKALINSEFEYELTLPTYNEKSYRARVNNYIAKHQSLKDSEGFEIFDYQDIEKLIENCNETLESEEVRSKGKTMQKYFNKYRSALILKLILLCGIRYEVVCEIKSSDLHLKYNKIRVNGFDIQLPKRLHDQFQVYEEMLLEIGLTGERESLFVEYNFEKIKETTSTTSSFLKTLTGRGDVSGLIKYRVLQLIRAGVNEKLLRQLTSIGETMYRECHEHVFDAQRAKRHINSMIINSEMFYSL